MNRGNFISCHMFCVFVISFMSKVAETKVDSKPACELTEVCAVKEYALNSCQCSNNTLCGSKENSAMIYHGVQFDFCQPVQFRQCIEGDIAWANKGLIRQIVYCICPPHLKIMEDSWGLSSDVRKYKCVSPRTCETNEACKVRNKLYMSEHSVVTSLKGLCVCPGGMECEETNEVVKPKPYIEWEQEIWRCRQSTF